MSLLHVLTVGFLIGYSIAAAFCERDVFLGIIAAVAFVSGVLA